MSSSLLLLRAHRRGGSEFTVPAVAPQWAETDTENKLAASGGTLVCTSGRAVPAFDDPRLTWTKGFAVRAGLTFEVEVTWTAFGASGVSFGFDTTMPVVMSMRGFLVFSGGAVRYQILTSGANVTLPITLSLGTSYRFRMVLLGPAGTTPSAVVSYSADGGRTWNVLWVDTTTTAFATLYAGYDNADAGWTSQYMKVFQGATAWPRLADTFAARVAPGSADTGQAWSVPAGGQAPQVAGDMRIASGGTCALTTVAGTGNGVWEADLNFGSAPGATKQASLSFRAQDPQNGVRAVFDRVAQTITVRKLVANVPTTVATLAAAALADNTTYRMRVVAVGPTISVYQDGVLKLTTSEAFGAAFTGVTLQLDDSLAVPDSRWDTLKVWW